jgi:hypothetical protein
MRSNNNNNNCDHCCHEEHVIIDKLTGYEQAVQRPDISGGFERCPYHVSEQKISLMIRYTI